jgi:hypothetical protein
MSDAPAAESLSEPHLNELLRSVDWRFLLRRRERPRVLVLSASRRVSEALALVADRATLGSGEADLVVLGFPTKRRLRQARAALGPGGEVACFWRRPRVAGIQRARSRLRRAGFEGASVHWPGPHRHRPPEFWLPLEAPAVIARVFAQRPAGSRHQQAIRFLWRRLERSGMLVPLCATAQLPSAGADSRQPDAIGSALAGSMLLLTEGAEARHKVVGLSFAGAEPAVAVKCARTAATDRSLEQEAAVLEELARLRPQLGLAPKVLARGELAGRRVIAESVVPGRLPAEPLTQATFARLAPQVTDCLLELVDDSPAPPGSDWRRRLVEEPLDRFEQRFAQQLEPGTIDRARAALATLPELPLAWEHRDCAIWNIHVADSGAIGLFDWAGSEPRGLPGLDLAYFLATSAFMIDRLEMSEPGPVAASYELLLDPATPRGAVAAQCTQRYCERLRLDPDVFALLRLRCWVAKATPDDPAAESYALLAAAELRRLGP